MSNVGTVGLNIAFANIVVIVDNLWSAQEMEQLIGRVWRHPQSKQVLIYSLIAVGTSDVFLNTISRDKGTMQSGFMNTDTALKRALEDGDSEFIEEETEESEAEEVQAKEVKKASKGKQKATTHNNKPSKATENNVKGTTKKPINPWGQKSKSTAGSKGRKSILTGVRPPRREPTPVNPAEEALSAQRFQQALEQMELEERAAPSTPLEPDFDSSERLSLPPSPSLPSVQTPFDAPEPDVIPPPLPPPSVPSTVAPNPTSAEPAALNSSAIIPNTTPSQYADKSSMNSASNSAEVDESTSTPRSKRVFSDTSSLSDVPPDVSSIGSDNETPVLKKPRTDSDKAGTSRQKSPRKAVDQAGHSVFATPAVIPASLLSHLPAGLPVGGTGTGRQAMRTVAWTVELGYGTPFLLDLGLTEQLTSLVWLAGPISGLIAQPVIGAISDASTSKYRRRYWIVTSTIVLVISTLTIAYCREIAAFFVDLLGGGAGSWDPKYGKSVQNTAIGFAIVSFYLLDFALNALQASLRNLLLDVTPPEQLNAANAWHSRMINAGNIVGYGFGFLPLANLPILRLLGGSQFRKFCVVCMIILSVTVWITCWTQEEQERPQRRIEKGNSMREVFKGIYTTILSLPKPIRRVCYVQVFAFMGWFPFLFYSTTYIGQVMAYELDREPDHDLATRTGAFAMLLYSIVAVAAGTLLPHLTRRDTRLLAHEGDEDEDAELARLRAQVREWRAEAARHGKPLRLPYMPFFLRNIWTGALLLFTFLTLMTFFVTKVWQAIILVSLVGICWAVACWAPFAIIMEVGVNGSQQRKRHSVLTAMRAVPEGTGRRVEHRRRGGGA
ncbi:hypothetical protein NUW54_g10059 [Trametes sanguinea]|uniref:Uncharacterized protein n=1 Tax=Trametes sanguinea TaxID=158606 RepID=A0ACC1P2K2_9APHY|nr:hypothetical protein NUW54_g10059 [Trametes sanguinea]